ncbi:hypothetical protein V5O48_005807 [Marasmius crinis-equi]|uniref:Uncharacterized protein n=1 Tax=Marasmius crinis-equi TaxID=585013 RepID=A0ABR3FLG6_9AGAR
MDPLQSAAQAYSWAYMTRTLDDTLETAEVAALKELNTRSERLRLEEAEISERRFRYDAEKDIEILDSLAMEEFKKIPDVIHRYFINGKACSRVMNGALRLSMAIKDPIPLEDGGRGLIDVFNDCIERIDALILETAEVQDACNILARLVSGLPDTSRNENCSASGAIGYTLPVLNSRGRNLRVARSLMETTKLNWCRQVAVASSLL